MSTQLIFVCNSGVNFSLSNLGPYKKRGCTDVLCCVLYLCFIGFWLAIGAVAFQNGNPTQILLPTDTSGNICGDGNKIDQKYLMYFDITKCRNLADLVTGNLQCPTYQMCTGQCPDSYWSYWTNAYPIILAWDSTGADFSLGHKLSKIWLTPTLADGLYEHMTVNNEKIVVFSAIPLPKNRFYNI